MEINEKLKKGGRDLIFILLRTLVKKTISHASLDPRPSADKKQ
jgi:hypothetical protein